MAHDAEARIARRLASRFSCDCWVVLCVRVVEAATHETGDSIVHTPDHYLAAAWAPANERPIRMPEAVVIGSPTASRAIEALLRHVPDGCALFLAGLDDVDAGLAARILLAADRNLEPYQREAIESFARAEQERLQRVIAARYSDRDVAFERFRDVVVGTRGRE